MLEMAGALCILALIGAFLVRADRAENGGLYAWQRSALLKTGALASGVVRDHAARSPGMQGRVEVHTIDLIVEFTPFGGQPLRVPLSYRLADGAMTDLTATGRTLPLRYALRDPTRVLIDWDAVSREPRREPNG